MEQLEEQVAQAVAVTEEHQVTQELLELLTQVVVEAVALMFKMERLAVQA
jgi:hypothetical protein